MALKIIAVDDEQGVLNLLKSLVEPLGFEVLTVADSREAARRVETEKFDGAILDVRMPHLDGFKLCERIRATTINRDVPIVMLTGLDDAETMRRGFKAGSTFFLGKPFTPERIYPLFRAIRGVILREKRRHARLPYRTMVSCQWRDKHFKAGSLNIGESGMALDNSGGVPVGEEIGLEFMLPQAEGAVNVRAKVLRKEPPDRTALEFLNLSPDDRNVIQQYILVGVKG
jgi:DNA-binding response OmpR family regulator